jgi:CheY-like chemotaxis protein
MKIILVEDDSLQSKIMVELLEPIFSSPVRVIETEHEFHHCLSQLEQSPPDIFVIDVMLRWTDPQQDPPVPPREVVEGGRERAGFRCHAHLMAREATRDIPVILYSHLDRSHFERQLRELPASTLYLQKDSDFMTLVNAIRKLAPGPLN